LGLLGVRAQAMSGNVLMTHKTGPRPKMVEALHNKFFIAAYRAKAMVSESFAACHGLEQELLDFASKTDLRELRVLQNKTMRLVRRVLKPLEKDGCPTCPD
jgi:hypothetical protein